MNGSTLWRSFESALLAIIRTGAQYHVLNVIHYFGLYLAKWPVGSAGKVGILDLINTCRMVKKDNQGLFLEKYIYLCLVSQIGVKLVIRIFYLFSFKGPGNFRLCLLKPYDLFILFIG